MMQTDLKDFHIFFNGPPEVGKTTLGSMLVSDSGAEGVEFKERLVSIILSMTGVTIGQWESWYSEDKNRKRPSLLGYSCRSIQQLVAEKMIKPFFGDDFFGRVAAASSVLNDRGTVYLDGGFKEELDAIVDAYSAQRVIVIRLSGNNNKSYSAIGGRSDDTRYYLSKEDFPDVTFLDVDNTGQVNTVFDVMRSRIDAQVRKLRAVK